MLFVDDDEMLLGSFERCLSTRFEVATATSGAIALERMREGDRFDVVVCDMRMPRMDGVQFVQQARELSPETAYVMLTGNQDTQTADRAANEGRVFRYLTKPCDTVEIVETILQATREPRHHAEAISSP